MPCKTNADDRHIFNTKSCFYSIESDKKRVCVYVVQQAELVSAVTSWKTFTEFSQKVFHSHTFSLFQSSDARWKVSVLVTTAAAVVEVQHEETLVYIFHFSAVV